MKKSTFAKLTLSVGLFGGITTLFSTNAYAASWHRGTPKAVRGIWGISGRQLSIIINSKGLFYDQTFMPEMAMQHPKYKFVRHNYYLIYGRMTNPTYKPFYGKYAVYRKGNSATIKGSNLNGAVHFNLYK